jgi:YidC/Oxa1 family membrane protein insertase
MFNFIGSVFDALIAKPIFNLLIVIIAFLPGHNLGVAIIIFTILVRLALYPLLKKQLHHAMAMRKLQPEMKRIKKEAGGDRQKEYMLMQALYKEREIKPFASIGILLAQLPILLALFYAINNIINNPDTLVSGAYSWVQNLPFITDLASGATQLNTMFLGVIDLTKSFTASGSIWALVLVLASVFVQYYQSKQLMMTDKSTRSLRQILKDSSQGKEVDQTEIQAATGKFTLYIIPGMLFIVAINLASALSLYWLVGSLIAIIQQRHILKQDVDEMEAIVNSSPTDNAKKAKIKAKKATEAQVVTPVASEVKPKVDKKTGVKTYVKTEGSSDNIVNPKTKNKTKKNKSKKRRR